jgi:hypothetical protein
MGRWLSDIIMFGNLVERWTDLDKHVMLLLWAICLKRPCLCEQQVKVVVGCCYPFCQASDRPFGQDMKIWYRGIGFEIALVKLFL